MKIVIAPGTFKGSATAADAAEAMALGVRRANPDAQIVLAPISDGGEGTAEALMRAMPNSRAQACAVMGPLGSSVNAEFVLLGEDAQVAALDMASASGLLLVASADRNPMRATTYGVGELIQSAARPETVEHIIIGLGGSATNDGGAGCLQGLGFRLLDAAGEPVPAPITPATLSSVRSIDDTHLSQKLRMIKVTIACDVDNPLTGVRGASRVFGPQKGADDAMTQELDEILTAFGAVLDNYSKARGGRIVSVRPGAGAAGGLGAGLMAAFPQAIIEPGIDVVLDAVGFTASLIDADLVLTGEGKLDSQTLGGKAIHGVLRRATAVRVPVVAIAGAADGDAVIALKAVGLRDVIELVRLAGSIDHAITEAKRFIKTAAYEAVKVRYD